MAHQGNRRSHSEARACGACRGSEAAVAGEVAQCTELRWWGSAVGPQGHTPGHAREIVRWRRKLRGHNDAAARSSAGGVEREAQEQVWLEKRARPRVNPR